MRTRSLGSTLAVGALLAFFVAPTAAHADQGSVPVDHQAYVSETPADPHNADPVALHIDVSAGKETAQSYIHLNFNFLPDGATLDSLVLTLQQTAPPSAGVPDPNNVNNTSAVLNFCLLTEAIPADITSSHPPLQHDCNAASRVGNWQADGSYKVDLRPLAARWLSGPNYGAAILPVQAPTDSYRVGFDRGKTATLAKYTPQPATSSDTQPQAQPQPQPAPAQAQSNPAPAFGGTGTTVVGPGAVVSPDFSLPTPRAQASAPAPAPVIHHQGQGAGQPATGSSGTSGPSGWAMFVLVAAAAGALGLLAYPLGHALSPGGDGVRAGLLQQVRLHPRLFVTTGVLAVYSLTFGSYTLAHPNTLQPGSASRQEALNNTPTPGASAAASTDASPVPGATPAGGQASTGGGTAAVAGSTQVINGTSVFVPSNGGPPSANLFPASQDRVGISDSQIKLCGHAALTYASAFNTQKSDFNVFWTNVNAHGGIYGRQVAMDYQNDNYDPTTAVQAAQQCSDEGIFMLLGGIGFDQIPNVRMWAEQNRMLYIHHIATENGASNLKYSFAPLPTVEEAGRMFADLYLHDFKGKKIGILHRASIYWDPGYNAFLKRLEAAGLRDRVVSESGVKQNQGSYAQELAKARQAGAEVMWAWENALDTPEMIKQAKGQQWSPNWMVFPFNVELTALQANGDALNPPIVGVAAWPAYTKGQYDGPFASYAADIHEFEREYATYDGGVDLGGAGGDLLFLNWVAQKQLYQQLLDCGRDCTRNKFAGMMLTGYKKTVSPNCTADWSRVSHRGGFGLDIFSTYKNSAGNAAWEPVALCVEHY